MADDPRLSQSFTRNVLPWVIGAIGLLLYLIGLQPWLTVTNLVTVSKILRWDFWSPNLQGPVYYLVTFPVRWLPQTWQVAGLNLFSAVCAAGTLGLLARCVSLLPQDRTTYQRMRNRAEGDGTLQVQMNWIPPLVACGLLGFQLTFWEHAAAASQEALNVLLFAFIVYSLLEYRLNKRDSVVYRIALVYGLAMSNNWAMIDFLPITLVAMVWIGAGKLLRPRLIAAALGLGLLGLLPWLLLPAVQASESWHGGSFWEFVKWELAAQKIALVREKGWLLCPLPALAGLAWMGLRWSTHSGEVSGLSLRLSAAMHQFMPAVFLVANVLMFFNTDASPREVMPQHSFLPLYFLSALVVGYFSGYFLLLGVSGGESGRRRPGSLGVLSEKCALVLAWGSLLMPMGLVINNAKAFADLHRTPLREVATHLTANLPARPALLLSDNPVYLLLVQADYQRRGVAFPHAAVSTTSLDMTTYQRLLAQRYPDLWKDNFSGQTKQGKIAPIALMQSLADQAQRHEIYYLHPSFGYYFEVFYLKPMGLVGKLELYKPGAVGPPPLALADVAANQAFWAGLGMPTWVALEDGSKHASDALLAGQLYSRAANEWGVLQQREGRLAEAKQVFEQALAFYPSNLAASLNLSVNNELQAGRSTVIQSVQTADEAFGEGRGWQAALSEFGSYDEPRLCYSLGVTLSGGGMPRQAAVLFGRARTLDPTNGVYHLAEAEMFLQGRMADKTLETIQRLRSRGGIETLSMTNQVLAARLEAMADLALTNTTAAVICIEAAAARAGHTPFVLEILAEVLTTAGKFDEALRAVDDHLAMVPGVEAKILQKAYLHTQLKQHARAIEALGMVLNRDTPDPRALELRAVNYLELGRFNDARSDYEALRKLQPMSAASDLGFGEIALREKKYAEARPHFENVLKLAASGSREAAMARAKLEELKRLSP